MGPALAGPLTWEIDDRSTSFPNAAAQLFITSELKKKTGVHSYPKMKYTEVPSKTEQKDSKNKQNVLLDGCYLLVEE